MAKELVSEMKVGISRACRALNLSRSKVDYASIRSAERDKQWEFELLELARLHPKEGFWKSYNRIRMKGLVVNHKRLYRIYRSLHLPLRRKVKKRLPSRTKEAIQVPDRFTQVWSIDFMSEALENGRKFRTFNVLDDNNVNLR
jgi:putative transposase